MSSTTAIAYNDACPPSSPIYGFLGATAALVFACAGALYGVMQSTRHHGNNDNNKIHVFPVIASICLAVLGFLNAMNIQGNIIAPMDGIHIYSIYNASIHLAAGLTGGLTALVAGISIGNIVAAAASAKEAKYLPSSLYKKKHGNSISSTTTDNNNNEMEQQQLECLLADDHESAAATGGGEDYQYSRFAVSVSMSMALIGFLFALILTGNSYVCA